MMDSLAPSFCRPANDALSETRLRDPVQCFCLQPHILESAVPPISYIDGDVTSP